MEAIDKRITLRVTSKEHQAIEAYAERYGISLNDACRQAIRLMSELAHVQSEIAALSLPTPLR